jgi:exodeoxyribonuclease VII small subunit
MNAPQDKVDLDQLTFEALLDRLDQITQQMESRDVGIEAAMSLYEEAAELHRVATARLDGISQRIAAIAPTAEP